MTKRLLFLLSVVFFSTAALAAPGQERSRPDVLILVGDDIGWQDFSQIPTPNLDALAGRGVTYRRFYVMPVCSPTRYALLFGRYGRRDGIGTAITSYSPPSRANPTPRHDLPSLAKLFQTLGYSTGLFGKWHVGSNFLSSPVEVTPHLHGFEVFHAGTIANLGTGGGSYFDWRRVDDGQARSTDEYATLATRDAFLRWWQLARGPRFALVAFHAAHKPFHVPPPEALPPGWPRPQDVREQFEAMVASLDLVIGDILSVVDERETLVFFLTDNGTANLVPQESSVPDPDHEGDEEQEKHTTLEPGINVPLIVAGPGVAPGEECFALTHAVDFYATLAHRLGVPRLGQVPEDSVSFAETLADPSSEGARRWVFSEEYVAGHDDQAVITARYKLRVLPAREELYDLATDPLEESPLDLADPSNLALRSRLRRILDQEVPPRKEFGPRTRVPR